MTIEQIQQQIQHKALVSPVRLRFSWPASADQQLSSDRKQLDHPDLTVGRKGPNLDQGRVI